MTYEISNLPKKMDEELFHRAVLHSLTFLELDVDLKFEIIFDGLERYQIGSTDYEGDPEYAEISVYISRSISPKQMIRVLFHEMAHVKQFITGTFVSEEERYWQGNLFEGDPDDYFNFPWELEALELEEQMMETFGG